MPGQVAVPPQQPGRHRGDRAGKPLDLHGKGRVEAGSSVYLLMGFQQPSGAGNLRSTETQSTPHFLHANQLTPASARRHSERLNEPAAAVAGVSNAVSEWLAAEAPPSRSDAVDTSRRAPPADMLGSS